MNQDTYYKTSDLARFGEIGRTGKDKADRFFDYYGKTMEDGALDAKTKSLIALAVAHALSCPYCIDSTSHSCIEKGSNEDEMMEAVHIAAAMAAGVTLVHSTQMLAHLDDKS